MENQTPKISVIVPVYNVEQYLPRCIESILAQTFTDFELLLVDDGSTDGSGKICDEYAGKDNRIRVFHKENGGVSSARNVGLDNARGEWVTFVDSDDWVDEALLSAAADLTNIYKTDMVCWGFYNETEYNGTGSNKDLEGHNEVYHTSCRKELMDFIRKTIYSGYEAHVKTKVAMAPIWNKLYSMPVILGNKLRFNTNLKRAEDVLFNIQYLKCIDRIVVTDRKLTHYIFRPSSAMHSGEKELIDNLTNSLTAIRAELNCNDALSTQCFIARCLNYLDEYFSRCVYQKKIALSEKRKQIVKMYSAFDSTASLISSNRCLSFRYKMEVQLVKHNLPLALLMFLYLYQKTNAMYARFKRSFQNNIQ